MVERFRTSPELLVVAVLLGAFVAVIGPAYVRFEGQRNASHARAELRRIQPAVDDYFADHGTYEGMTLAKLRAGYDLSILPERYVLARARAGDYCIQASSGGQTWHAEGPAGELRRGACRSPSG
jgi:Tfp pilus assembly protein PilE